MRLCPASSPPCAVVPALVFSRGRRPSARVVSPPRASSSPRALPPQARRPPSSSWPTATAIKQRYKRRERDDGARGGHDAGWPRAPDDDTGHSRTQNMLPSSAIALRVPWSILTFGLCQVLTANQKVRNKKPEESPFNFRPNVQDSESIISGFSTFRRECRKYKIPIQFMASVLGLVRELPLNSVLGLV